MTSYVSSLTADLALHFFPSGKLSDDLKQKCEETVRAFLATPLCPAVEEAIKKGIKDLLPGKNIDDASFAVRSSAAGELC